MVLVDDAQEEVLTYNRNLDLVIHKVYNPTYIKDRHIDIDRVRELKEKYGKYLLMVSRFEYPHKDHYTVVKSLQLLREKYSEDINLVFVGSGPEEDKIRQYIKNLGGDLESHIFFEGTRHDVQNYYKSAYLLVHASIAGEGLPTVMIESMAYGLPMVVTDSKTGR